MHVQPIHRRLAIAGLVAATAVGFAAFNPAGADDGVRILGAGRSTAIAGSYIVVLKSDAAQAGTVSAQERAYGAIVKHRFTQAVHGYAASMSQSRAKQVAADPNVAYVEQNQRVTISSTGSWGVDRIDQRDLPLNDAYTAPNKASNVNAYIIDTGITVAHSEFDGRAKSATDIVDGDSDASDCQGHGTHVAGTIGGKTYGVAKGVTLNAVRVLDCQGSGSTADVIAGVDWVTQHHQGPSVANMSLGGGSSTALDDAVSKSIASGVTYAVASGNGNAAGLPEDACTGSPSKLGGSAGPAIVVNASDKTDNKASFSNYGKCTDIYAPGVDITSAWIGSNSATNTISGTSMATPHVTGAAALYLSAHTDATPAQVKSALVEGASDGKIAGVRSDTPNKLLYIGDGSTPPADPPTQPSPTGCDKATSSDSKSIPDGGSATSSIAISGCDRKASTSSKISVDIKHPYRGDLQVDLIAPNGTSYRLKNTDAWDSDADVKGSVTRDLSSHEANGTWKLKVTDAYTGDTGTTANWSLDL